MSHWEGEISGLGIKISTEDQSEYKFVLKTIYLRKRKKNMIREDRQTKRWIEINTPRH